jgi:6-phosphogluconolactonase
MKAILLTAMLSTISLGAHAQHFYIGAYTGGESRGIYRAALAEDGALTAKGLAVKTDNPSFLAGHPALPVLYAVGEGAGDGTVTAFHKNEDGMLEVINHQSSGGNAPCHVAVSPDGALLAAANYGGGSVVVFDLAETGEIKGQRWFRQHEGKSANASRQEAPHAHAVHWAADGKRLYVVDLGIDRVIVYASEDGAEAASIALPAGSGPRHLAFGPTGKTLYCVNELNSTVSVYALEETPREVQHISTLPEDFTGENYPAEIALHPNGKWLYASNRGHNSIALFHVDESGKLTAAGHSSAGGDWPRHFTITPSGTQLLVANQNSDNIVGFHIDSASGALRPTGHQLQLDAPVCLLFTP